MLKDRRRYLAMLAILIGSFCCYMPSNLLAQRMPFISHIQPDAAAPGMTVALEILSHVDSLNAFGPDGIGPSNLKIQFENPSDTQRVIVGIPVVSWNGRMIQVPLLMLKDNAFEGTIPFRIVRGNVKGNVDNFSIQFPQEAINVNGVILVGENRPGFALSKRNTLVVRSVDVRGSIGNQADVFFSLLDTDLVTPGNPRYLPVTILSEGPIRFTNVDVHLEGSKEGIPGGGGGGSGNEGPGGPGYTGGGSTKSAEASNVGSGNQPTDTAGGASVTGVKGGSSHIDEDQGGGGGTGHPFGSSGKSGTQLAASLPGGFGAGSAGGESSPDRIPFGGGGGGFAADGEKGGGDGNNQGKRTGGRFLIPLAGGSGGGAGNTQFDDILPAGHGGGGGGALALVSFDSLILTNTVVYAHGDSGTTGVAKAGSGGGGSGGAFIASSNTSIKASNLNVNVNGGRGGKASAEGNAGGNGASGIARLDGVDTCANCTFPTTLLNSLSQRRIRTHFSQPTVEVSGYAGEGNAFTNNIRIYYRNYHTAWTRVDTVKFVRNGRSVWRKTLPALNDSLLFVIVYQEVNTPRGTEGDYEPQWITTHVAHQILKQNGRAVYSAADTLFFPQTKTNSCSDRNLTISNLGEAVLKLTSVSIPSSLFTVAPLNDSVLGYSSKDLTFTYCPTVAGCDTIKATIQTNDGPQDVYLIGCAIDRDERVQITPDPLVFGRVKVEECDSSGRITIVSQGDDEVEIDFASLVLPSFRIDTVGKKKKLASGESETYAVHFCPTDSGEVSQVFSLRDLNEGFTAKGTGVIRSFEKRDTVINIDDPICLNYVTVVEDTIVNLGNDPIVITRVETSSSDVIVDGDDLPWTIFPHTSLIARYELRPSVRGQYTHRAVYYEGNDSLAHAIFAVIVIERAISFSSEAVYACASDSVEGEVIVKNLGNQVITITPTLTSQKFTLLDQNSFELSTGDNVEAKVRFRFNPANESDVFDDSIKLLVSVDGCGDTIYSVPIRGESTVAPLVVSPTEIFFDSVLVGECRIDSVLVSNVCGPQVILSASALNIDGFSTSFTDDTIGTGESAWIVYEYCPTELGNDSVTHTINIAIQSGPLDPIVISLSGIGKQDAVPVHTVFTIQSGQTTLGAEVTTVLSLDTLKGLEALNSTALSVTYEPEVVQFRSAELHPDRSAGLPVIQETSGKVTFTFTTPLDTGKLLNIVWLGLLGSKAATPLILNVDDIVPSSSVVENSGNITLSDCIGLAGNVNPGGPFEMGIVRPQPVGTELLLPFRSGADATGTLTIKDPSGRTVRSWIRSFKEGDELIALPVDDLPGGVYWIEVDLVGFRQIQNFWK